MWREVGVRVGAERSGWRLESVLGVYTSAQAVCVVGSGGVGRGGWRRGGEDRCRHSLRMIRMPRMKRIPAIVRPPIRRVW